MSEAERQMSQDKRRRNREFSTNLLAQHGVPFVVKNEGAHLIVADRFDFWPGTGLFTDRQSGRRDRGVRKLLRQLQAGLP